MSHASRLPARPFPVSSRSTCFRIQNQSLYSTRVPNRSTRVSRVGPFLQLPYPPVSFLTPSRVCCHRRIPSSTSGSPSMDGSPTGIPVGTITTRGRKVSMGQDPETTTRRSGVVTTCSRGKRNFTTGARMTCSSRPFSVLPSLAVRSPLLHCCALFPCTATLGSFFKEFTVDLSDVYRKSSLEGRDTIRFGLSLLYPTWRRALLVYPHSLLPAPLEYEGRETLVRQLGAKTLPSYFTHQTDNVLL